MSEIIEAINTYLEGIDKILAHKNTTLERSLQFSERAIKIRLQYEQNKQLTRIAESLHKIANPMMSLNTKTGDVSIIKPCQDCCKTAGKVIKDKAGSEREVPDEFNSMKPKPKEKNDEKDN